MIFRHYFRQSLPLLLRIDIVTLYIAGVVIASLGLPATPSHGVDEPAFLTVIEAESGILEAKFAEYTVNGAICISISPDGGYSFPGDDDVVEYTVTFPEAGSYQLYARILVEGPQTWGNDSFYYADSFGKKSTGSSSDWIAVIYGLENTGYSVETDEVYVGGGSAGADVWKWQKFSTLFTVNEGALTQTFQIGGREDGFFIDKLVFGPSDTILTVANLNTGTLPPPPEPPDILVFDGADGIAVHRFGEHFQGWNTDGANPAGGLTLLNGKLYGTTLNGGDNTDGTAFVMSPDGESFTTEVHFDSQYDAAGPQGNRLLANNNFYGTTLTGGNNGTGGIYMKAVDGSLSIIHHFSTLSSDFGTNTGGAEPAPTLTHSDNMLYGTTRLGGSDGEGCIFSIGMDGSGFTVLHNFSALDPGYGTNNDGIQPSGGVVISEGRLFGTTTGGGTGGSGVVFAIDTDGSNFMVLHYFSALDVTTATNPDGAFPTGGLVFSNGTLYGTTLAGGSSGNGTVFSVTASGQNFTGLHNFSAYDPTTGFNNDGAAPVSGLIISGDILYGTASGGGSEGTGSVFVVNPLTRSFTTLYSFEALTENETNNFGAFPVSPLLRMGNSLYGTAFSGGPGGTGTVFQIPITLQAYPSAAIFPDGSITLTIDGYGLPGASYTVQAADELGMPIDWQSIMTIYADSVGAFSYSEANLTTAQRFYRIIRDQ